MSAFAVKKINDEVVKPIPLLTQPDKRPIKGSDLFPELYANVFFCAKKKSGKTVALCRSIRKCCGPKTKIMVFSSTFHRDPNWTTMKLWAQKKGVPLQGYTSLVDDDGTNLLGDLIKGLQAEDDDEEEEQRGLLDSSDEEEEKERPAKYQAPEWIFVLDDLSDELKKPIIATFLKKNRHFKSKVFVSSQYMNDLFPAARKQLDYVILFRGHSQKKIDEIHRDVDIHISKEEFYYLYQFATEKPFSFLYLDVRGGTFRRNFNELIELSDE
ncbi:MAG: hypothetical protein P4L81_03885 [Candidatus Pacebacteria bacterium]|nr:hypothetical protein [Candidatus Paceibacterota bacterium]